MNSPDQSKFEILLKNYGSPAALLMAGGATLAIFHLIMRSAIPDYRRLLSDIFICTGFSLFLVGAYCIVQKRTPNWVNRVLNFPANYLHITQNQFIATFFAIILSITATISAGFQPYLYSPVVSLFSWAASIILVVVAGWEKSRSPFRLQNREWQLVICLFILALALRAFDTTNYPNALGGDEASQGISSLSFVTGKTDNIFNVGWYAFPSLFYLIQSIGIRILGQTIPSLRITSAIIGSMTVIALYFVVKEMFNKRIAFISSLLLAFSHYHIHFSRIGLNNIWDGLSWVVTLGALWLAWNRERKAAFIFTGLCLGFSQYFYTSARSLFVIVPVWLIFVAIQNKEKFWRMLPNIILLAISAFIVVLPLAWFFLNNPNEFQAPMMRVSILGNWLLDQAIHSGETELQILMRLFTASFLGLTVEPLRLWYEPGYGLLRPISAGLFYLGSVLMLFRFNENRVWQIILWLGLVVTGGAVSSPIPAAQRYVAAAPACMMIIGYGIDQIIKLFEKYLKNFAKIISVCILFLVFLLGVDDAWFYFYNYSPRSNFGGYHTQVAQRLANTLQNYDSSWEVFFSGWPRMGFYSISTTHFLAPHIHAVDLNKPWGDPANVIPDHQKAIFVFLPGKIEDLYACMEQYPGGELKTEYKRNEKLYYQYKVQIP